MRISNAGQGRGTHLAWLIVPTLRDGLGARSCCWHLNLKSSPSQLMWVLRVILCHARVLCGMLKAGVFGVSRDDGRGNGCGSNTF